MSILIPKFPADPMMNKALSGVGYDGPRVLNLGAGINPIQGAVNHDLRPSPDIQITFNVMDTPWPIPDESYDKILCFHMIEHIPVKHVPLLFKEMNRVLVMGGLAILETPDIRGACETFLRGNMNALSFIYANDRFQGDQHRWGYTAESLAILATTHGFPQVYTGPGTDYHSRQMPTVRLEAVKGLS